MKNIVGINNYFVEHSFFREGTLVMFDKPELNHTSGNDELLKNIDTPEKLAYSKEYLEIELKVIKDLVCSIKRKVIPSLCEIEDELKLVPKNEEIDNILHSINVLKLIFGKDSTIQANDIIKHVDIPTTIPATESGSTQKQRKWFMSICHKYLTNLNSTDGFVHQINVSGFSPILGNLGILCIFSDELAHLETKTNQIHSNIKKEIDILSLYSGFIKRNEKDFLAGDINISYLQKLENEESIAAAIEETKETINREISAKPEKNNEKEINIFRKRLEETKKKLQAILNAITQKIDFEERRNKLMELAHEQKEKIDRCLQELPEILTPVPLKTETT